MVTGSMARSANSAEPLAQNLFHSLHDFIEAQAAGIDDNRISRGKQRRNRAGRQILAKVFGSEAERTGRGGD